MNEIHEPELEKLRNLKTSLEETLADVDAQISHLGHKTHVVDLCKQFKKAYILKFVHAEEDDHRLWGLRLLVRHSVVSESTISKAASLDTRYSAICDESLDDDESNTFDVWRHPVQYSEPSNYPYGALSTDDGPLGALTVWTTFEGIKTLIEQCSFEKIESNNKDTLAELESDIEKFKNHIESLKKEDEELNHLLQTLSGPTLSGPTLKERGS